MLYVTLTLILFGLSFVAGMLGLGVAFIATPVLGLFGFDLKHVIMPWSLWLNGLTAISGAAAFARARMVDWRTAVPLLVVTTAVAPLGVWLLQFVPTNVVWYIYAGVLIFLAWRMAFPPEMDDSRAPVITDQTRKKGAALAAVIGVFAGFLGVGPGFLMMPSLVMLGYTARIAAATNSVIVTFPSFSAFAAHLGTARFDWPMLVVTSAAAIAGAQAGAIYMSRRVKSLTLSRLFAAALFMLAVQRLWLLLGT
jgi:uncharacterized membrane protein YfcA